MAAAAGFRNIAIAMAGMAAVLLLFLMLSSTVSGARLSKWEPPIVYPTPPKPWNPPIVYPTPPRRPPAHSPSSALGHGGVALGSIDG
ncbi:hypothetical protein U9M48_041631 [Paspalum notatum var. saurae]|uniref:Uncharacterized protein n=1 Tax=Paspalum notatum var. saurae TaxID=547442 RepID=A0AAQ3UQV7_PASNO